MKKITLTGMVQNRYGRKYWIPKDFAYAGINYLVQGTSADIMSERMIAVHEYLKDKKSSLIMQVHDEILLEVATGEEYIVDSVKNLMEENSLGISLLVDVEIHDPSWAHVRDVSKVDEEQEPEPNVQELLEEIQKLNVDIDYWKAKYEYVEELLGSVGGTDDWVYEDRFARA